MQSYRAVIAGVKGLRRQPPAGADAERGNQKGEKSFHKSSSTMRRGHRGGGE
jgi:hypothetical protein